MSSVLISTQSISSTATTRPYAYNGFLYMVSRSSTVVEIHKILAVAPYTHTIVSLGDIGLVIDTSISGLPMKGTHSCDPSGRYLAITGKKQDSAFTVVKQAMCVIDLQAEAIIHSWDAIADSSDLSASDSPVVVVDADNLTWVFSTSYRSMGGDVRSYGYRRMIAGSWGAEDVFGSGSPSTPVYTIYNDETISGADITFNLNFNVQGVFVEHSTTPIGKQYQCHSYTGTVGARTGTGAWNPRRYPASFTKYIAFEQHGSEVMLFYTSLPLATIPDVLSISRSIVEVISGGMVPVNSCAIEIDGVPHLLVACLEQGNATRLTVGLYLVDDTITVPSLTYVSTLVDLAPPVTGLYYANLDYEPAAAVGFVAVSFTSTTYFYRFDLAETSNNITGAVVSVKALAGGTIGDPPANIHGGSTATKATISGSITTGVHLSGGVVAKKATAFGAMFEVTLDYTFLGVCRSFSGAVITPDGIRYTAVISNGIDQDIPLNLIMFTLFSSVYGAIRKDAVSLVITEDLSLSLIGRSTGDTVTIQQEFSGFSSVVFSGPINNAIQNDDGYSLSSSNNSEIAGGFIELNDFLFISVSVSGTRYRISPSVNLRAGMAVKIHGVVMDVKNITTFISSDQSFTEVVT